MRALSHVSNVCSIQSVYKTKTGRCDLVFVVLHLAQGICETS